MSSQPSEMTTSNFAQYQTVGINTTGRFYPFGLATALEVHCQDVTFRFLVNPNAADEHQVVIMVGNYYDGIVPAIHKVIYPEGMTPADFGKAIFTKLHNDAFEFELNDKAYFASISTSYEVSELSEQRCDVSPHVAFTFRPVPKDAAAAAPPAAAPATD